ncbi:protein AATF-like [Oppia nitens]|uniref:protein AATF-like n=1 Tax=Oppia nitens TaxID=1686743 RepID=UPI0023DB9A61|nr:protein AATF-like [Oppia nitens]
MSSLSQQISSLINPLPSLIDPEDDLDVETSAITLLKNSQNSDQHIDHNVNSHALRNRFQSVDIISHRYAGQVVNRTQIESDFSSDENDEEEDIGESESEERVEHYLDDMTAPNASSEDLDYQSNDDSNDHQLIDINDDYIHQLANIDVNDDISKGRALKNQLIIWDNLLEYRIKLQKVMMSCNKCPQFEYLLLLRKQSLNNEVDTCLKETYKSLLRLLNIISDIDISLDLQNSITNVDLNNEFKETNNNNNSDSDNSWQKLPQIIAKRKLNCDDISHVLSKRFCNLREKREDVLNKWYERTRLTSNAFKNKCLLSLETSTNIQINRILNDTKRLIKRTQTKRSIYSIVGKDNETEEEMYSENVEQLNVEIFDDDDFYHQLLRQFIETNTNTDSTDPFVLSKKWLEIQRIRNKIKRKVDTKASKGRRIRYDVHSKIVNFMAPIHNTLYTDEAKDQLFKSLFGKLYQ